jgi:hypothetical protein
MMKRCKYVKDVKHYYIKNTKKDIKRTHTIKLICRPLPILLKIVC